MYVRSHARDADARALSHMRTLNAQSRESPAHICALVEVLRHSLRGVRLC